MQLRNNYARKLEVGISQGLPVPWVCLRWFFIFPMENPPWLGNRWSEYFLFFGHPESANPRFSLRTCLRRGGYNMVQPAGCCLWYLMISGRIMVGLVDDGWWSTIFCGTPNNYIQIRIAWEQAMVSSEDFPKRTKPLTAWFVAGVGPLAGAPSTKGQVQSWQHDHEPWI